MKFPKNSYLNGRTALRLLTLTLAIAGFAGLVSAQRTLSAKTEKTAEVLLAESATLEQCRNGSTPTNPRSGCQVVGGAVGWVTGNAGAANSNWAETQFLAYRMLFGGLTIGSTNTVTIGYDIFHQSVHAIDYLGTYNATETNANPCIGVTGCTLASPTSTFPIPQDTVTVTPFITQLPGEFTMWGGTITSAVYEPYAGGDERRITLTFTAHVANPVLAWSGHVAWRGDWGAGQSAGGISGSPYHMRLIALNGSGGNQDRSLSADAVLVPARVQIVKRTLFGGQPISFDGNFSFSSTGINFDGTTPDDGVFVLNTATNAQTAQILLTSGLGAGFSYPVTEIGLPTSWSLNAINCVETNEVGFPNANVTTTSVATLTATIRPDEAEIVVCTFDNAFAGTTAAPASISGRITTADGAGIYGARVSLMNATTGETHSAITNPFGYYSFSNMPVENLYVLTVGHKRYEFADNQRTFTLNGDLIGLDFTAY